MTDQIFVSLLGESVDVWRPVLAERLQGQVYRIVSQPYDELTETWRFVPADVVACELVDSSSGKILAAVRLAKIQSK